MFPKKGNSFPNGADSGGGELGYAAAIAAALKAELGSSHQAVKTVMRWTGANERTVKNWLAGKVGPRGEHLIGLLRHSNSVLEIILRLACREQIVAAKMLLDARNIIGKVIELMDASIKAKGPLA
jgi:pyocin large subunit-like protein